MELTIEDCRNLAKKSCKRCLGKGYRAIEEPGNFKPKVHPGQLSDSDKSVLASMYQKRYVCSCVNKRLKKAKEDVDRESGSSDRETKQASETRRTSVSELLPDGK